ncbi:MAG: hypothetical protein LBG47_02360 [Prevotellaceae bacterium]|jgi:hypothetical protein|nr:hypothetical protein [Prevotellaceae bacterium]
MEQEILRDTIYVVQSVASGAEGGVDVEMIVRQLTPIIIIVFVAVPSFIVLRLALTNLHKERMATIEKGVAPIDLKQSDSSLKYLRRGIIWAAVGLSLTIGILAGDLRRMMVFSLPFLFLGAGWIVYYYILVKKSKSSAEA